jgi:hypothetical protein
MGSSVCVGKRNKLVSLKSKEFKMVSLKKEENFFLVGIITYKVYLCDKHFTQNFKGKST